MQWVRIMFILILCGGSLLVTVAVTHAEGQPIEAPYPASRAIVDLTWAPSATIVRKAEGSDNWPTTWADDGELYTAYGDGWGFDPKVPEKLSLGLAKVIGPPTDFSGVNIRSPTGEQKGDGASGKKASGMLMVDGVLYMWVRNAGNSQLAWSSDHGETWAWSKWRFTTSFGYSTFLNFGKNYGGARDGYVYTYSHDNDSAYSPADRMVLARVPKEQITHRDAYEFFAGCNAEGDPTWSKDVAKREAVFTHSGRCYRSGISYNAALKRYLWCQIIPGDDTRFEGGFGIYDAPEPWGPWTTAYFTERWDVGPGETASFPTKWISGDGKTLYLVFSGNDSFSVRKATLTTAIESISYSITEGVRITWQSVPGASYTLYFADVPLSLSTAWNPLSTWPGTGNLMEWTDDGSETNTHPADPHVRNRFYGLGER